MYQNIVKFILDVPSRLGQFGGWLFTELPYIHLSPIGIFSIGGITAILVLHIIHLVNVIGG